MSTVTIDLDITDEKQARDMLNKAFRDKKKADTETANRRIEARKRAECRGFDIYRRALTDSLGNWLLVRYNVDSSFDSYIKCTEERQSATEYHCEDKAGERGSITCYGGFIRYAIVNSSGYLAGFIVVEPNTMHAYSFGAFEGIAECTQLNGLDVQKLIDQLPKPE